MPTWVRSRLPLALGVLALAAAAPSARPLDGEWVFHPRHLITDSASGTLAFRSDTAGNLYFGPPLRVRNQGKWRDLEGTIASEEDLAAVHPHDYWIAGRGLLNHFRGSEWRTLDTNNSCIKGNTFRLMGLDPEGKVVVDGRFFFGLGGPTTGFYRVSENSCASIDLQRASLGRTSIRAYHADEKDREYFALMDYGEVPDCHELLRLEKGRLDTLARHTCFHQIASRREAMAPPRVDVYFASKDSGVYVARDSAAMLRMTVAKGYNLMEPTALLVDSRRVLWIATREERVIAIGPDSGGTGDTVGFEARNANFPDGHATHFAEDSAGNVWVAFSGGQFSIFARDKSTLSTRRPPFALGGASKSSHGVDALGRRVPSSKNKSRKPVPRRLYGRPNP